MTLSEASYYFQKTLPIVIISFLLLVIFYLSFKIFSPQIFSPPKKQLVINPVFKKLPPINFSHKIDYPSNLNFVLDTIEGEPITATESAKIFSLKEGTTRFGYLEKIYLIAKTLGFDVEKNKHSLIEKNAIFEDEKRKLSIDISNFNFEYQYQYEQDEDLFKDSYLPEDDYIKEKAKELLRLIGRYPEDLAQGKENIIYLNYDLPTKEFIPVENKEEANAVEIDYYRKEIDNFPILTPKYFNSQNFIVLVFKQDEHQFIKAQVKYFEGDYINYGIYPVKTGEKAWQELIDKKANIVSLGKETQEILIKKMFFGYYDPDSYQKHLQPVYVFLGDNGFVAYVSAITEEYVE